MVEILNNSDITKRQPNETTLQYYAKIKKAVDDGLIELSIQDMYQLIYGEYKGYDYSQRCLKFLKDTLELDESGVIVENISTDNVDDTKDTDIPVKTSIEINKDGTQNSSKLIQMSEEQSKDADFLLEVHGYNKSLWEVIGAKSSIWQTNFKGGITKDLYSSRITVKPRRNGVNFEDIDNYFNNKNWYTPIESKKCNNYEQNGEFLEIDLADAHLGLLAHYQESGNDYNIDIAVERVNKCIDDIIYRIGDRKFEKIYYCCLGDFLHTDSFNNTTFKGTPQSVDSRFPKIFDSAMDLQISIIDRLSRISHVVVPYVAGNHDKTSGYTLIKAVEKAFRNCDNVMFDTRPIARKIIKEGKVLVGLSHGNMNKKNAMDWLISEYKQEFADAVFVENHSGHCHSIKTLEEENKTIIHRSLPTICYHSSWEYEEGYPNGLKAVLSFVWNKNIGLRDIWISNPNVL